MNTGFSIPLCIIVIFLRTNSRGSGQVWFAEGTGRSGSPLQSRWDCAASKPQHLKSQSQHPPTDAVFNSAERAAPAVIETPALGEVTRLHSSGVGCRLVFVGSLAPAGAGFGRRKAPDVVTGTVKHKGNDCFPAGLCVVHRWWLMGKPQLGNCL